MTEEAILTRRAEIEARIEALIALLDLLDGDPDLEPDNDGEPLLGAPEGIPQGQWYVPVSGEIDECEEENEHGGDILDERHDDRDEGDFEPFLGWSNPDSRNNPLPAGWCADWDSDVSASTFNGDGHHIGRKLLREKVTDRRKLALALDRTRVSPAYGKYV